jgi:hypothetical protein
MYKKNYKYVVSIGCSFSAAMKDYSGVYNTYGDYIAKYFDANSINLSKSGTSNYRICRKLYDWSLNNKENIKDTLFLIGLTQEFRIEFWYDKLKRWFRINARSLIEKEDLLCDYLGDIGHNKKIKWSYEDRLNFFDNFLSNESYLKLSQIQILIGLQSFMDINDADYLFFDSISHFSNQTDTITYDYFESFINKDRFYIDDNNFNFDLWIKDNELYCHDKWHPNQEAHHLWGEKLLNYINK